MTSKTYSVAGVSTLPSGATKIRFANDFVSRFKNLVKSGHTNIELIELGGEFTKAEIAKILLNHADFQNETAQNAITEYVVRNAPELAKELEPKTETAEEEDSDPMDDFNYVGHPAHY